MILTDSEMTAHTAFVHEGRVLGKPAHPEEARSMLRLLQGGKHEVFTGVAVASWDAQARVDSIVDVTEVVMMPMTDAEIADYVSTGEPMDKAFGQTLLDLQNEEIEHLAESAVRDVENLLRWLVPGLLATVIILSFGIWRLASRAQRLDEMEALNEARNSFIASVSHELRTPLTAVVGLAHEMRDGLPSFNATEIQEFAGLIAEESGEVASIVEDLLVAARSEAGSLTVVQEDVDLRAQVEQLLRMDRLVAGRDVIVTANGSAVATADGARVRQILRNLLTNAARYGGENIEVGVEPHNGKIRLFVADDGPGIPEQDRERIFEPYQRAHQVPGVPASVGLGLTVSRHLARAMGGDLSYRYDGRSVLELVLPAADAKSPA